MTDEIVSANSNRTLESIDTQLKKLKHLAKKDRPIADFDKWTLKVFSADDGYEIRVDGLMLFRRDGLFHESPPNYSGGNLYARVYERMQEALLSGQSDIESLAREIIRKMYAHETISIDIKCDNKGGPSHYHYEIDHDGTTLVSRKINFGTDQGYAHGVRYEIVKIQGNEFLRFVEQY